MGKQIPPGYAAELKDGTHLKEGDPVSAAQAKEIGDLIPLADSADAADKKEGE